MAEDPTPTTARRALGAQLRQLRQERELTIEQVADHLGAVPSTVSRLETGDRAVKASYLERLIELFSVGNGQADQMKELARQARRRRSPIVSVNPDEGDFLRFVQSGFVELEKDAIYVREFNEGVIPGLLQTPDYMRAMMVAASPEDADLVENAIALRVDRQRRLERHGQYSVIIDECALLREVGGPGVMADQLADIVARAELGAVEVRVIPLQAGYHPGVNSSFVSLTMASDEESDVVFLEGLVGFQKLALAQDLRRIERVWAQLVVCAASLEASLKILSDIGGAHRRRAGRAAQ